MPWSYPDNIPSSMKYFKPSIQKKAISIANHVLESTGDEGVAIATGIKKAKQVHSQVKSFHKIASLNWANDAADAQSNVVAQTQAMNHAVIVPKMSKMMRPKSFKVNFAPVGAINSM